MAHKTMISGTAYEVKGGRTMVDGSVYDIKKGRTLIDGTGYDIEFGCTVQLTRESIGGIRFAWVKINDTTFPLSTDDSSVSMTINVPAGTICECFFQTPGSEATTYPAVYLNGIEVAHSWYPDHFTPIYTYTINQSVSILVQDFGYSLENNEYGRIDITE